jgi:hypothetical protein
MDSGRRNKKETKEVISIASLSKDLKKVLTDFHPYNDYILKSKKRHLLFNKINILSVKFSPTKILKYF